jgi:uncharacterized surface protein with fasciclin (FAS1) repeats
MNGPVLFRQASLFLAVLLVGFLSGCKKDGEEATPQSATDVINGDDRFTLLETALTKAGLADALRSTNNITVFAPTDAAFRAAGYTNLDAIPAAQLASILQYHVLPTRIASSAINIGDNNPQATLLTTNGTLYITRNSTGVSVNGARVTAADINASNGVIHAIDKVLLPPPGNLLEVIGALNLTSNNSYSLVVAAAQRAGSAIVNTLSASAGPYTLFVPTNAAFAAANLGSQAAIDATPVTTLQALLLNHVIGARVFSANLTNGPVPMASGSASTVAVNGNTFTITGKGNGTSASNITRADVVATNGVIHVIDRVLLP